MFAGYQSGDHELELSAKYFTPGKNSGRLDLIENVTQAAKLYLILNVIHGWIPTF